MAENTTGSKNQQTETQTEPQAPVTPASDKKFSFGSFLRRGTNQYNPMPKEQKFTPPPQTTYTPNTPLSRQPSTPSTIQKTPKSYFEFKIILLVIVLLALATIIIATSLHFTEYFIYEPPASIKNLIESVFSKIPKFNLDLALPSLPFVQK